MKSSFFSFLFLVLFFSFSWAEEINKPRHFDISEDQLKELVSGLVNKVDVFKAIFEKDSKAIIFGGAPKSFSYWVASHFREVKNESDFIKRKAELLERKKISAAEFMDSKSDVDVISRSFFNLNVHKYGIEKIQLIDGDRINKHTKTGQDEIDQGYIPVEKMALTKYGYKRLPQFGNPVWELITGNISLVVRDESHFWRTYYARKRLNHPILLALRYLRLASLDFYYRYGKYYPNFDPVARLDEESVFYIKDLIKRVVSTGELNKFLAQPQVAYWIKDTIAKSFSSFSNVTATDSIMKGVGFNKIPQKYSQIPPYNTFTYIKEYDEEIVKSNLERYNVDVDKFYRVVGEDESFMLYHGTKSEEAFYNIINFGNLPSSDGAAGAGTYATQLDEVHLAISWAYNSEELVVKFPVEPGTKIVDMRSGEGRRVFSKFGSDYDKFAEAFGVDIIRYPLMGIGAYIIKNGGVVGQASPYSSDRYDFFQASEDIKEAQNLEDIEQIVSKMKKKMIEPEQFLELANLVSVDFSVAEIFEGLQKRIKVKEEALLFYGAWAIKTNKLDIFMKNFFEARFIPKKESFIVSLSEFILPHNASPATVEKIFLNFESIEIFENLAEVFFREKENDLLIKFLTHSNQDLRKKTAYAFFNYRQNSPITDKKVDHLVGLIEPILDKIDMEHKLMIFSGLLSSGHKNNKLQESILDIVTSDLDKFVFKKKGFFSKLGQKSIRRQEHLDQRYKSAIEESLKNTFNNLKFFDLNDQLDAEKQFLVIKIFNKYVEHTKVFLESFENYNPESLLELDLKKKQKVASIILRYLYSGDSKNISPETFETHKKKWLDFFKNEPEVYAEYFSEYPRYLDYSDAYYVLKSPVKNEELALKMLSESRGILKIMSWIHYLDDPNVTKKIHIDSLVDLLQEQQSFSERLEWHIEKTSLTAEKYYSFIYKLFSSLLNLEQESFKEQMLGVFLKVNFNYKNVKEKYIIGIELARIKALKKGLKYDDYLETIYQILFSKYLKTPSKMIAAQALSKESKDLADKAGGEIFQGCSSPSVFKILPQFDWLGGRKIKENLAKCLLENNAEKIKVLSALEYQNSQLSQLLIDLLNKKIAQYTSVPKSMIINWMVQSKTRHPNLKRYLQNKLTEVLARAPRIEMRAYLKLYSDDLDTVLQSLFVHKRATDLIKELILEILDFSEKNPEIVLKIKEAQDRRQSRGKPPIFVGKLSLSEWIFAKTQPVSSFSCGSVLEVKNSGVQL